jgi:hypothetical protein
MLALTQNRELHVACPGKANRNGRAGGSQATRTQVDDITTGTVGVPRNSSGPPNGLASPRNHVYYNGLIGAVVFFTVLASG